jgi:hypothetical protein
MKIAGRSIEAPDLRRLAVEAEVHEQTIRRFLLGLPVRALSERRIRRAASALGLPLPIPTNGNAAVSAAAKPTATGADHGDPSRSEL